MLRRAPIIASATAVIGSLLCTSCANRPQAALPSPTDGLPAAEAEAVLASMRAPALPGSPLPDQAERVRRSSLRSTHSATILVIEAPAEELARRGIPAHGEAQPIDRAAVESLLSIAGENAPVRISYRHRVASVPMQPAGSALLSQFSYIGDVAASASGQPDPLIHVIDLGISAAVRLDTATDGGVMVDGAIVQSTARLGTVRYRGACGVPPLGLGGSTAAAIDRSFIATVEEPTILVRRARCAQPVPLGSGRVCVLPMAGGVVARIAQYRAWSSSLAEERIPAEADAARASIAVIDALPLAIPSEVPIDLVSRSIAGLPLETRAVCLRPQRYPAGTGTLSAVLAQLSLDYRIPLVLDPASAGAARDAIVEDGAAADLAGHLADLMRQTGLSVTRAGDGLRLSWGG